MEPVPPNLPANADCGGYSNSADAYSPQPRPTMMPSLLQRRNEGGGKGESGGDERGEIVLTNRLRGVGLQQHCAVMRRVDDEPRDKRVIALVEQFPHIRHDMRHVRTRIIAQHDRHSVFAIFQIGADPAKYETFGDGHDAPMVLAHAEARATATIRAAEIVTEGDPCIVCDT